MDKKALIKALRDTVQSASNTVASGVSAPVDLIAAGLRKVGLPIPQAPVGGSQWMENMGLTVPVEDGIPKLAGETLGMIVPMAATAKAPQIAAAANRGLENLAAPRTLNTPGYGGQRGAIVWHGSPYKFDAFDASKIGTGEGAQAYGHGLYFAESPDVAKGYRDLLTKSDKQFYIKGKRVEPELLDSFQSNVLNAKGYGRNKQDYLDELEMNRVSSGAIQKISKIWDEMGDVTVKEVLPENASLYKVDLPDEAIARMLDWDKPLSQQSKEVKTAVNKMLPNMPNMATGEQIIDALKNRAMSGIDPAARKGLENYAQDAAFDLASYGIPGIRYLDEASRNKALLPRYDVVRKKDGATVMQVIEGNEKRPDINKLMTSGEFELRGPFDKRTRNFVVFPGEERLLRILERNNQPMGLMGVK